MKFELGTKLRFKKDLEINHFIMCKGEIVTVAFHDHNGIELLHNQVRGTFEFKHSPSNAKAKIEEYFEVVESYDDRLAELVSFLKPLLISGIEELVSLCDDHGVEIDDGNLFRPASRLMCLGAKVKDKHRYLYLQLKREEVSEKMLKWITHVDNFNESDKEVYISVNSSHGTAYCINIEEAVR